MPLRNGSSGSVIIETLHKYKLHRKLVGLLPEGDHQDRPLARCLVGNGGISRFLQCPGLLTIVKYL
jgi:hypothetical protein